LLTNLVATDFERNLRTRLIVVHLPRHFDWHAAQSQVFYCVFRTKKYLRAIK